MGTWPGYWLEEFELDLPLICHSDFDTSVSVCHWDSMEQNVRKVWWLEINK
jgi:hypothetical protein